MRWAPRSSPSKGPRRLCKFCSLAIILPVILLCIPLYMRFTALSPHDLILSPSDMKLLNHESVVSTTWCKSQNIRMNHTFNAYLFNEKPRITTRKRRIKIEKKMVIADDMKKYWGFYLLKGSSVRLGGCARYPGSSVVIVRGPKNTARCAWLGELDSQEESDEYSNEFDVQKDLYEPAMEYTKQLFQEYTTEHAIQYSEDILKSMMMNPMNNNIDTFTIGNQTTSDDFYKGLDRKYREYYKLMKEKNEKAKYESQLEKRSLATKNATKLEKLTEELNRDEYMDDDGSEDLSDYQDQDYAETNDKSGPPDHLVNSGIFDQKNTASGKKENSREEVRSSDSSSEEALRNCKGVIKVHEFAGRRKCGMEGVDAGVLEWFPFTNDTNQPKELLIEHTGFYYFIFSNENEITNNTVIADIELNKTFFNTNHSVEACRNATECQLYLDFWSNQHVLVEVPSAETEDSECDNLGFNNFQKCNFIVRAESECQPRGELYMVFLLLVPVIIILFAFL